ncbi:ALBINO3-like protein 3, mitochondrial [Linum perenne]
MAIPKLIYSQLRRTRTLFALRSITPACVSRQSLTGTDVNRSSFTLQPCYSCSPGYNHFIWEHLHRRSFSTRPDVEDSKFTEDNVIGLASEVEPFGLDAEVAKVVADVASTGGEESILPVRALISVLDGYHDITGLPWWFVIASATVFMRMTMFPFIVLQLKKMKQISEFIPKLPPPLPPPQSGRSFFEQISLFRKERKALGCPSYLWFLASFSLQVPCFLLAVTSIRRMSLNHHPGFECGGALWFQNLTELPHGLLGSIFPVLISGLHFVNVQLAFQKSSFQQLSGPLGMLAKYYKHYLDFLVLPLFYIGYCIPQGSLVYWVTNSSLSIVQHFVLRSPGVRTRLGLPEINPPSTAGNAAKVAAPENPTLDSSKWQKVVPENLSPTELLGISVKLISTGHREQAIPLLRAAVGKDPDYIRALAVLGQTLLQKGEHAEAAQFLEPVITKILANGVPTQAEEIDILILTSQWAGIANIQQGKQEEGLVHLERVASLKEPDDPKSKVHYFDGLILLASALYDGGRKPEALTYARLAAAYNPTKYKKFMEMCEKSEDNLVIDLVSSRRRDY